MTMTPTEFYYGTVPASRGTMQPPKDNERRRELRKMAERQVVSLDDYLLLKAKIRKEEEGA